MTAYYVGLGDDNNAGLAATMAFAVLTFARLFHGFNCRSKLSMYRAGLLSNRYSIGAFLVGVCLLAIVLFVPFFERLFSVAATTSVQIVVIVGLSFAPTLIIQIVKMCAESITRRKKKEDK